MVKNDIIEKWSKERDVTKPYCKDFSNEPTVSHALWVQAFCLSVDDRLTTTVTAKNQKATYMSSGRLDNNGESLITNKNISKETKIYRDYTLKQNWPSFNTYSDYITKF